MLIENVYKDMIAARMGSDPVAKSLLVTFYAEASRVGKDKRNGQSTDEEVISTARKFISNAEETIKHLETRNLDVTSQKQEVELLQKYLPKQFTKEELTAIVQSLITELNVADLKGLGQIMAQLKARYNSQYDGKMASEIVKSLLTK